MNTVHLANPSRVYENAGIQEVGCRPDQRPRRRHELCQDHENEDAGEQVVADWYELEPHSFPHLGHFGVVLLKIHELGGAYVSERGVLVIEKRWIHLSFLFRSDES